MASEIRTEYLRDNDNYVVHFPRTLRNLSFGHPWLFHKILYLFEVQA